MLYTSAARQRRLVGVCLQIQYKSKTHEERKTQKKKKTKGEQYPSNG